MTAKEISPSATHVPLAGTQWSLWRQVVLRAPGFPAGGVDSLASAELAAAADGLTEREANDAGQWSRYRTVFEEETRRLGTQIMGLAAAPRFQLALAWQNHRIFDTAIAPMRRNQACNNVRRNSKQRQHEELIANYWQRYCVKNDTIGFTGPVGWSLLDPEAAVTRLETGEELIASSEVYFEIWVIDRLAAAIAAEPGMTPWIPPRKLPFVRIAERHATVPAGISVELTAAESAVLSRCTGEIPARDIARECAGVTPEAATEEDVYAVIRRLCRKRLITWKLEVPLSPHPERHLRRFLEHVGDPALAAEGLSRLDRLVSARQTAWAASHSDPAGFVSALRDLDETFVKLAGAQPSRRGGQAYGGRTLIYHDARRDAALTLGADFLAALRPLELLLDSARWLSYHFAARIQELFTGVAIRMSGGGTSPDLASFCFECIPLIARSASVIITELQRDFQQRWAAILRIPADVRRVSLDGAALRDDVRESFDVPHSGWAGGRYCSPDLMIAAGGVDAINEGDFDVVLGEMHLGIATSRHYCFVTQHPSPDDLLDCLAVDWPGPRLLPVLPKENRGRLTVRTSSALTRDMDFLVAVYAQTAEPGRPRLLNAADLTVSLGAAGPVVTIPGGLSFPVIDVLAEMLADVFMDSFELVPPAAYQPRIAIDRLVVVREAWRFDAAQIGFAQLRDEPARFAAGRRWRRAAGLPRRVFVQVTGEVKPFFVDFDSVISVNILAKSIRRLQARRLPDGPDVFVQFSEMLPSAESLWLTDSAGGRYTSELRIVAVDQRPISAPQSILSTGLYFGRSARAGVVVMSGSPEVTEADVGRYPLSSQQRLWCAYDPAAAFGPRFIIARSLRVSGRVDTLALQEALDDVAARHEILRTVVVRDAEPPYQRIHPPSPVPLRVRAVPDVADTSRDAYAQELLIEAEQSSVNVADLPLLRADLSTFDDRDSVLTVASHHTAGDAWSMQLIIRDLAACYTARAAGQLPALPPVRQYREFTAWEQSVAASPMAREARAYWRQKLQGARFFALPVDHPVAQSLSSPYNSHHFTIDADVMTAVSAIAKSTHATPFMVLLAAIDVLAYQITGTTDPVIRNIAAGRGERQFQDTVGVTLSFAPLRTDTGRCGSFRELVESVRDTCIEASSRDIPLDIIAQEAPELNKSAEDPHLALFLLGYYRQSSANEEIKFADGAYLVRMREPKNHVSSQLAGGAVWTMHLLLSGELKCRIEFNSGAFNPDTIAGLSQAFHRILAKASAEPERKWATL